MKYDRHEDGTLTRLVEGEVKTLVEFRADGQQRCKAWLREKDRQCGSFACKESDVCMSHGAAAIRLGPAHHNWKHGRYSKLVPNNLKEVYETSVTDPEILVQRDSIALCDARMGELLEQLSESPSPPWKEAGREVAKLRTALAKEDPKALHDVIDTLDEMIKAGSSTDRTWEKIFQAMKRRGDSVEQERRRLEAQKAYITGPQVVALATRMVDLASKYIDDRAHLALFIEEVKLLGNVTGTMPLEK